MSDSKKIVSTKDTKKVEKAVVSKEPADKRFTFVHQNQTIIHDAKFKTKPTTFAKDAFKRFCKNKSSVVAAIIIGILLLASIFTPIFSPYTTTEDQSWQQFLDPKLFEPTKGSNNSFWNGTKMFKDAIFDPYTVNPVTGESGIPVVELPEPKSVNPEAIVWQGEPRVLTRDDYSPLGFGGTCINLASKTLKKTDDPLTKPLYTRNLSFALPFDSSYEYSLDVKINSSFDYSPYVKVKKLRVCASTNSNFNNFVTLVDWFDIKDEFNVNLTDTLVDNGLDNCNIYLSIEGLQEYITDSEGVAIKNYMAVDNIAVNSTNENITDILDTLTADGNEMCVSDVKLLPWISNASRVLKNANYYVIDFLYDRYEHVFGKRSYVVGKSKFNEYIAKGWCEFNFDTMEFKILDEKCPIVSVESKVNDSEYNCVVTYYKYKGLSSVPKYIFGSTPEGHDLFTKALGCLKTSLLVAIIATAICLVIGLVWGSISGYFGGTVDLVMERITDIISGVPWTVMMTLIILLLGSNIYTFALALVMTSWIGIAGRTRTQFYRFRDREYVLASRTLGASDARLIFKHILPNGLGTIVTSSVLMIPSCIFSEASVSYLGLGLKGVDSFGVLFSEYQQYLGIHPMLIIFPAIIISLLMISFNLFGNGLRDALNPTLKGGEQ